MKKKIAIFASGNGTNAENIIRTFRAGNRVEVTSVVCNVRDAGVMGRAAALFVPTIYISNKELAEAPRELIAELKSQQVDLIVLAGFMRKIPDALIEAFPDRIINIHPSLLPKFGGKGMWGHHVHEAVVAAGEVQSGVTVHYVNNIMDGGRILMQETIDLMPGETPTSLESKIHTLEYSLYPRAIVAALDEIDRRPIMVDVDNDDDKENDDEEMVEATLAEEEAESAVNPTPVPPAPPVQKTPPPTPDQQWAKALHINFQPPKVTPPIPGSAPGAISPNMPHPQSGFQPGSQPAIPTPQPQQKAPMPSTYMVWAIVITLLCCLPAGIVAIVFASQVSSKYYQGDMAGAIKASNRAQIWIIVAFVLGVIWSTVYIPLSMLF